MLFRNIPIRRKLMTMILGTSGVTVILTCLAFLGYELLTFRQVSTQQLSTLAEVIAANSTGAVAFDNQRDATEILFALRAEKHIVAGALYDKEGNLFSRYPAEAPEQNFPPHAAADGFRFENGYLVGFTPVVQLKGRQRFGTLFLKSDLEAMHGRLRLYAGITALAILVSAAVAYVLSRTLQRQISRPILALAETARAVSDRRDYSVRAKNFGPDEIGLLTDAFNQMLGQIDEQNLALQRAYDDLRRTQQAILQQERLRALGQMASGIAHDINNAISPASLYLDSVLQRDSGLNDRTREYLTNTQRAIEGVAQTVSRLREFYRQREPQLAPDLIDLNQLAGQVVDMTHARWGDIAQQRGVEIKMRVNLDPALPPILGVANELREALTNLIFNAVDAMPDGGNITVETRYGQKAKRADGSSTTAFASIEVIDSGLGMDEETKRRCLEPFFTTKGERGTGLGLAMVYGTVQRHHADIEIDTAVGRGTTMRIIFPLPTSEVPAPTAESSPLPAASPLKLLLVDDDAALLTSLTETLREDGHEIVGASGGQAGIEVFSAALTARAPFDVVITDLGMPQVDGRRVARAVKAASPTTPVFLLTGWGQLMAAEGDVPAHVDRMLNKPPKLREIRIALAAVAPKKVS